MFSRLKSLPLTIVLTILIWMYAEAQFTSTRDNVRLSLKIVPQNPDLTVRVFDTQGNPRALASIVVTMQGPKNEIDRIYQQSQNIAPSDDDLASLTYLLPTSLQLSTTGDNSIDTLAVLNSLSYFRHHNIIFTAANPARLRLDVDTLERIPHAADFRPTLSVSHFSINPEQVTLTIPSRTLQTLGGPDKINILATPLRDLATLPADVEQTVPVRFTLDAPAARDDRISITPSQGTLSLRLPRRAGITETVPDVPVWVAGPPSILAHYNVELRPKSVRVTVSGSASAISALRQQLLLPPDSVNPIPSHGIHAYVDLTPEDRPSDSFATRKLRYVLPENLTLQEAPQSIDFRLTSP
jgi:hypothetical protein